MRPIFHVAFAAAVFALLVICSPVYATKTDDRIESSAKKSYVFKTFLKDDEVKIQARNGAVTLTGLVSQESYKTLAEKTVTSLSGVKSVDNRLEVKGAPPSANSDAWIKEQVKTTLLFHQSVNSAKVDIDVKDGVVTLQGKAKSLSQKELAAEYARDVEEVKDVKNEMTVSLVDDKTSKVASEAIDDPSITAQVKMALLLHRSTSSLNTSISTKRGIVTVKGKVSTAAIKDQVAKIVKDVHGVKGVKNQMTIE